MGHRDAISGEEGTPMPSAVSRKQERMTWVKKAMIFLIVGAVTVFAVASLMVTQIHLFDDREVQQIFEFAGSDMLDAKQAEVFSRRALEAQGLNLTGYQIGGLEQFKSNHQTDALGSDGQGASVYWYDQKSTIRGWFVRLTRKPGSVVTDVYKGR